LEIDVSTFESGNIQELRAQIMTSRPEPGHGVGADGGSRWYLRSSRVEEEKGRIGVAASWDLDMG